MITCELPQAEFARDQIHAFGADWRMPNSKGFDAGDFGGSLGVEFSYSHLLVVYDCVAKATGRSRLALFGPVNAPIT